MIGLDAEALVEARLLQAPISVLAASIMALLATLCHGLERPS